MIVTRDLRRRAARWPRPYAEYAEAVDECQKRGLSYDAACAVADAAMATAASVGRPVRVGELMDAIGIAETGTV